MSREAREHAIETITLDDVERNGRHFRVQPPFGYQLRFNMDPRRSCKGWIRLDGRRYNCVVAVPHNGVHDANERHSDGGLVRW